MAVSFRELSMCGDRAGRTSRAATDRETGNTDSWSGLTRPCNDQDVEIVVKLHRSHNEQRAMRVKRESANKQ